MDPALWELLRAEAGTDGDRVLEAIIRLARPGIEIPDVRIVSRFGTIATCRIRARDVIAVRARPDVCSVKAARGLSPGIEPDSGALDSAGPDPADIRPADIRRDPALTLTGAGVAVAVVGWGADVDSAALRWPDDPAGSGHHRPGGSRFLAFWDQRDQATGPRPDPYGYGTVHDRADIDRALQDPRPYERLGYHPAIADPGGTGSHDMRTIDIAAGNGRGGGPEGIAPEADLIFVHLADRDTGRLAPFGNSVRALEAVDFISRTAGSQPCSINISAGRICGPHTGTALVEMAFDELLASTPGRFISQSCGNYARRRAHSCGTIAPGEARSLTVVVDPADITLNEVEIWYDGADEFAVRIDPPGYTAGRPVRLGERSDLLVEGRVIGRVYHRKHDPNNGDNHIVGYLDPVGRAGNWTITLEARRVFSGRFHAWIERDDSCPGCQARFTPGDSNTATTIGSITTSHLPLIVGAYNAHDPARPAAPFSSHGPTRDGRRKPDLVAPGVDVLAGRSAPIGASHNPGLLTRGSGTSFAAPHVTGAVALCFQAAGGRLRADQIRSLVLGSCDPVPGSDPYRFGRGYLNIPRLVAGVRRALAAPATAPRTKETAMDAEDAIMLLAAAPATAYREYLYRPGGSVARWIGGRFEIVARPGERIGQALREGDVLLEVTLGRIGPGRCVTLAPRDLEFMASRPRLAAGRLVLRPRKRAGMTAPLPVEPAVPLPAGPAVPLPAEPAVPLPAGPAGDNHGSDLDSPAGQGAPADPPTSEIPAEGLPEPSPPGSRPCCLLAKKLPFPVGSQAMDVSDIAGHQQGYTPIQAVGAVMGAPKTEGKWGFIYTCAGGFIDLGHAHDQIDLVQYHYQMLLQKHAAKDTYPAPLDNGLVTVKTAIPKESLINVAKSIAFYQALWHEIWTYWDCDLGAHDSAFSPEDIFSNAVGIHAGAKAALGAGADFNTNAAKELVKVINALGAVSAGDTNKAFDAITGVWVKGEWRRQDYLQRRNFSYDPAKPWLVPGFGPCGASGAAIPADVSLKFDAELSYYDISFQIPIAKSTIGINPGDQSAGACYAAGGPHGFVSSPPISVSQFTAEIDNIKKAAKAKYGAAYDSPV